MCLGWSIHRPLDKSTLIFPKPHVSRYVRLSFSSLSSSLTHSDTITSIQSFTQPITYPLLLILISTAFLQVNFINKSLQRFESRVVIPTQYMTFALSSILGSAILYGDFRGMEFEKLLNFGFGCLVSAAGEAYTLSLPHLPLFAY